MPLCARRSIVEAKSMAPNALIVAAAVGSRRRGAAQRAR